MEEPITFEQVRQLAGFDTSQRGYSAGAGNNKNMLRRMMKRPVVAFAVGWKAGLIFARDGHKNLRAYMMSCDDPIRGYYQKLYPCRIPLAIEEFRQSKLFSVKKEFEPLDYTHLGHIKFKSKWHDHTFYLKSFKGTTMKWVDDWGTSQITRSIIEWSKSGDTDVSEITLSDEARKVFEKELVTEQL